MNKKALIEAILFMASEPVSIDHIKKIARLDEDEVREILAEIKTELEKEDRGINLIEFKDGWEFKVKPEYIKYVKGLTPYQDLSRGLLKVLALVAYKQPISQSDIVKVIGNRTYEYVKKLEKRGLIRCVKAGRTKHLYPTKEFANYFGVEKIEDLKKILKVEENEK